MGPRMTRYNFKSREPRGKDRGDRIETVPWTAAQLTWAEGSSRLRSVVKVHRQGHAQWSACANTEETKPCSKPKKPLCSTDASASALRRSSVTDMEADARVLTLTGRNIRTRGPFWIRPFETPTASGSIGFSAHCIATRMPRTLAAFKARTCPK
ncbi:hypothetical protein HZ326_18788 [Fusarium oxysporum f. sp. albedinis]|nr:hypothetical protein HZ326_18788 [Fusarium oxysporum f. sp. albedinis]